MRLPLAGGARNRAKRKKEFRKKKRKARGSSWPGMYPGHVQQHDCHAHRSRWTRLVSWASAGSVGFKGSRKGTPYARAAGHGRHCRGSCARSVRHEVCRGAREGPWGGPRIGCPRACFIGLAHQRVSRTSRLCRHNGCRPPKRRRASRQWNLCSSGPFCGPEAFRAVVSLFRVLKS